MWIYFLSLNTYQHRRGPPKMRMESKRLWKAKDYGRLKTINFFFSYNAYNCAEHLAQTKSSLVSWLFKYSVVIELVCIKFFGSCLAICRRITFLSKLPRFNGLCS